jgi:dipeptidyl aminopeptidase/acylaminoacyl peptidase
VESGLGKLKIASYGSWKSPISSDLAASKRIWLGHIALDGDNIYWIEVRPAEGGRYVIVRWTPDGKISDMTPPPLNARTRVHEYGGGMYNVSEGIIHFCNFDDQRIYRQEPGVAPYPITPKADLRYADIIVDRHRSRLICVREDHRVSNREAENTLVSIDLKGSNDSKVLVSGNNFYSSPRLSSDGSRLAWLTWNHPNMPWDGTELWIGELGADVTVENAKRVVVGIDESIIQPEWSAGGVLHFLSDRSGWWNLYRWLNGRFEPLCKMEADFGWPQWVFGVSSYAFESANNIICMYSQEGIWHLASLTTTLGKIENIRNPYTDIWSLHASQGLAVFAAGAPNELESIVKLNLVTSRIEVLQRSCDVHVNSEYLSVPNAIEFPTEKGLTAHAFFYAPKNGDFTGPSEELPPLLVISHSGPTATASTVLSWDIQYFTSRGFAVVDVNYGGSSGYGRAYRQRLNGQWDVVDLDDCVNAALHLVRERKVDGNRLAIRGGSAGGYTTLCALTFRDLFKAGASYFGVSDLEALTKDTHKFESRYLDRLIGPYPERQDLYRERSPIHFIDQISCPIIFFQGLEDKVVPPSQAQLMVDALRKKGLPVAYLTFDAEQHGFRKAKSIKRSLEAELHFYSKIFGFKLADPVEPLQIENL